MTSQLVALYQAGSSDGSGPDYVQSNERIPAFGFIFIHLKRAERTSNSSSLKLEIFFLCVEQVKMFCFRKTSANISSKDLRTLHTRI